MMLVYYCSVDEERQNSGMLKGTYPENPAYEYTKYQQEETTHKYGLPPRLSHASDKLAVLCGHHKTESLAVE